MAELALNNNHSLTQNVLQRRDTKYLFLIFYIVHRMCIFSADVKILHCFVLKVILPFTFSCCLEIIIMLIMLIISELVLQCQYWRQHYKVI